MLRGPDARLRLIAGLLIVALVPVVGQLVRLQVLEHRFHQNEVEGLVRRQYTLPDPPWGLITDRNGDLLIGNTPVFDVGAELTLITDTHQSALDLAPLLKQSVGDLEKVLSTAEVTQTLVWRPVAQQISLEAAKQVQALELPWVTLTPGWQRYYAEGALAGQLLGFVNREGMGYGILASQMRFLRGGSMLMKGELTGADEPLPGELVGENKIPYAGISLRLTLDRTVQAYIEGELDRALEEYSAPAGTILVMDPRSGEILALASRPSYEPSRYADYAARGEEALFLDPACSVPYEPGSLFKVVTVAAALDSGSVNADWSYVDRGAIEYGGVVIYNWNRGAYGQQGLQGVLAHSLNVGVATLTTQEMGAETFYRYVRAFGFGQHTGVEISEEEVGVVHLPDDWSWSDSYLGTNAFGQGIAVTTLQMATAVAAIANEGEMLQPHIVAERLYPDGRSVRIPSRPLGHPISEETARIVTGLMEQVVEKNLDQARVPGYRIAGKSGTAQIPTTGGYDPENVIASFVGFGPLPDPQVLILVKLERPDVPMAVRWGSQTAAPLFQRVASRVLVLLGIPPGEVAAQP